VTHQGGGVASTPPLLIVNGGKAGGIVSERETGKSYRYRQRLNTVRRRTVRYRLSAIDEQRQPVVIVDLRNDDRYPWSYKRYLPVEVWDLYRFAAIAFSAYTTSIGLAAFFHG
jgi:hypothetical protein